MASASTRSNRPHQRPSDAGHDLQRLGGLDGPEEPRQHAEDAALGAGWDLSRGRRGGVQAAIAGSVGGGEDRGLPVEPEDARVDVGAAGQDAGVVHQVTGDEVVGAIHHQVMIPHEAEGVAGIEALAADRDGELWVQVEQPIAGRLGLRAPDVLRAVEHLPLEIRHVDPVRVDDREMADPRRSEVERRRGAEAARSHEQDSRALDPSLALQPHLGKHEVAAVPAELVGGERGQGWSQSTDSLGRSRGRRHRARKTGETAVGR